MPTPFDPIAHLVAFTQRTATILAKDLNAISEEQATISPGGGARSPVHIVAECATLNGKVAEFLRTGEFNRPPREQMEAHLLSFDTKEKALAYLEQETAQLFLALESIEVSTLGEDASQVFGRPMSCFAVAELPASHMMYHDGQLNYIHTLYGDSKVHW